MKTKLSTIILTSCAIVALMSYQPTATFGQRRPKTDQEKVRKETSLPAKRELQMDDILKWNRITESAISPDGKHIAVKLEPWKGHTTIILYNNKGAELFRSDSASALSFDYDGKFLYFKKEVTEEKRVKGAPSNTNGYKVGVISLDNYKAEYYPNVKTHSVSNKEGGMLFLLNADSTMTAIKPGEGTWTIDNKVYRYSVSQDLKSLLTAQKGSVVKYRFPQNNIDTIWKGTSKINSLSLSEDGSKAAFLAGDSLLLGNEGSDAIHIASGVSDKRSLVFSQDCTKLYFGFKIPQPQKDTTISKEDFPEVHIWNWNEKVQFTQQVVNKQRDKQASLMAVYNLEKGSHYTITNGNITDARLIDKGNSNLVLALSDVEYQLESMWTGRSKFDVYLTDTYLERAHFALKGIDGYPRVSPAGKYLYWYSAPDSSWATYSLERQEKRLVTRPNTLKVYDLENDVPDWPSAYGAAGWGEGDNVFYVYDKYDIWKVDPTGEKIPGNLTQNGQTTGVTYRYTAADPKEEFVKIDGQTLLTGFDNKTKGTGYYLAGEAGASPKPLYKGDFMLGTPIKATKAEAWIFTKERFDEFPDIRFSNGNFESNIKITNANSQQENFIWGSAELVSWTSYDGVQLEGVVYKPQNFDPAKKYPVIVNFYDKNSSNLHSYRTPEPHRSTVDYHWYNSHGYMIFNPDVVYKDGYPGESAFNAVMPGVSKLIESGIADPARIGAQGHSWGGYQVAYLATRTNLFAAIESGAPVVNMYSAYGGIRWGTGLNRSFQYEHQQSRIGKTPWESPLRYMENSPIFTMDKVNTPILIMHNDQDGHVPWYQGIEYFVALKRLRKPVWLLNYTGEVHWPQKLKNKVDFQIRMKQFFDHYLKGLPAPQWMDPGIPAIELEVKTGY